MNIFVTDISPRVSAQNLDDKRVVKMVVESAQLLSTAIFLKTNSLYPEIYRPTHKKHPCAIWTANNLSNWNWLFYHFKALCNEYTFRYNKKHKTASLLYILPHYSKLFSVQKLTKFANCARSETLKVDFKQMENVYLAYQKFLTVKWQNDKVRPKWTNRFPPVWYQ